MTTADLFLQYDRVLAMVKPWVIGEHVLSTKKNIDTPVPVHELWLVNMLTRTLASIKEADVAGFSGTSSYARLSLVYEQIKLTCSKEYMDHIYHCAVDDLPKHTKKRVITLLKQYPCMMLMSVLSQAYVQLNEQMR